MRLLGTLVLPLALLVVACQTTNSKSKGTNVGFFIDSITDRKPNSKRHFAFVSGNPNIRTSDLYFREFSAYVGRALTKQGYVEVGPEQNPELAVVVGYWVGDAQSTTVSNTITTGTSVNRGRAVASENVAGGVNVDSLNRGAFQQNSSTVSYTETSYAKGLTVTAVDWQSFKKGDPQPIWQTSVQSRGYNTDLREEMPLLVRGGMTFFGKDTGKQRLVLDRYESRDPGLRYIAGNMQAEKLAEGDISFESAECRNTFTGSLSCGPKITGLKPQNNKIKIKVTLINTSVLSWRKPKVAVECYQKSVEIKAESKSETKIVPVATGYQELAFDLKPQEKKETSFDWNLEKMNLPKDKKILCDMRVSDAQEIVL